MRNPRRSVESLPKSLELGAILRDLLETGLAKYEGLKETAKAVFEGSKPIPEFDEGVISRLKAATHKVLSFDGLPEKTLDALLLWGWAEFSEDLDGKTLATWIQKGAPLGFEEKVDCNGLFPKITGLSPVDSQTDAARKTEAEAKGFCRVLTQAREGQETPGETPILDKLGVVVKFSGSGTEVKKKSRIIWDMRESRVNDKCDPAERIILPRLMDVVAETLRKQKAHELPTFAAVDIQDAFHNIPSGSDKKYTAAKVAMEDGIEAFIIYDVLVFGSKSSPTIWGRFAAYLGRILCSVIPEIGVQIYVDDPIFILPNDKEQPVHLLTLTLLLLKIFGYLVKLEKADAGSRVKWIGASRGRNGSSFRTLHGSDHWLRAEDSYWRPWLECDSSDHTRALWRLWLGWCRFSGRSCPLCGLPYPKVPLMTVTRDELVTPVSLGLLESSCIPRG